MNYVLDVSALIVFFCRVFCDVVGNFMLDLLLTDPVKPGLFYNHLCHSFIHSFGPSSFFFQSSRYHKSQTIRARKLKF